MNCLITLALILTGRNLQILKQNMNVIHWISLYVFQGIGGHHCFYPSLSEFPNLANTEHQHLPDAISK